MNEYQIWANGAIFSLDEIYLPRFLADSSGSSFADACCRLAEIDNGFRSQFDVEQLTYWGMSLHSTKRKADMAFLELVGTVPILEDFSVKEYFSHSNCLEEYTRLVDSSHH